MPDTDTDTDTALVWGEMLSAAATEALRDDIEPLAVGGDADWRLGAVYLYDLPDGYDNGYVNLAPGQYLRTVYGGDVRAYDVTGDAAGYVDTIEQTWLAETDG